MPKIPRLAVVLVPVLLAPRAHAASLPPPLAQATNGRLQCFGPDVINKTCTSTATYAAAPDGTIEITSTTLAATTPLITMTTISPVEIRENRVCTKLRPKTIDAAIFHLEGQLASDAQATILRQKMLPTLQQTIGREICTEYEQAAGSLLAKATVNGAPQPDLDRLVIWIDPSDGYRLGQ